MPGFPSVLDTVYRSQGGAQGRSQPQGIAAVHHVCMLIINALLPSRSPWRVMRRERTPHGGFTLTALPEQHPVETLLQRPSKGWTPDRFFTSVLYHYLTLGNVGIRIEREGDGLITGLWPGMFVPYYVRSRPNRTVFVPLPPYGSNDQVEWLDLPEEAVIRLMWPGGDSEWGPSPLYHFCRFATTTLLGIEKAQKKRLDDLANYGVMLEVMPEAWGRAANKRFVVDQTATIKKSKRKADAEGTPLIIAPGRRITFPGNLPVTDQNAIALGHFALNDIALVYNLPIESLAEPTKFSKSASEVAAAAHRDCFDPIARRVASELSEALLSPADKEDDLQIVIDLEGYQVSSRKEAMELYGQAFSQWGIISLEEARMFSGLPPRNPEHTFVMPRGTGGESPVDGGPQEPNEDDDEEGGGGDLTDDP